MTVRFLFIAVSALTLAACGVAPDGVATHDSYERTNRAIHGFNKGLDRYAVRPLARGYDRVLPDPVEDSISNFASNLGEPGTFINHVLQFNIVDAGKTALRFTLNSTIGVGGLFDASTIMGLEAQDTDFGETLYTWGFAEGAYVELPVLGPSTERAAVGFVVDQIMDPVGAVIGQPASSYRTGARVGEIVQKRHQLGGQLDRLYDDSVDSYAQLQLLYLQNRRYQLGYEVGTSVDDYYDDPYLDAYE
ncbi:MAG: MlaA family lipoprotein [Planktomarina sp.]